MQTRSKNGIYKPKVFSAKLDKHKPLTIEEAFTIVEWTKVSQKEYHAFIRNKIWELVPLPANRRGVGCKWIFKLK